MDTTLQLLPILTLLNDHDVEYVVIGGIAATVHGALRPTYDLDICAALVEPNLSKILQALRGIHPRARMRPERPPIPDDPAKLAGFRMLNLLTDLGVLDILSEVEGVGSFKSVFAHATLMDLDGVKCKVLDIAALIAAKSAAGRVKDRIAVVELEQIQRRTSSTDSESP